MTESYCPPVAAALLRHWLRETHTTVRAGTLDVPLPACGCAVHAEVEHASAVGAHRFTAIELRRADGVAIPGDPASLLAALLGSEVAARGGGALAAGQEARLCARVAATVLSSGTDPVAASSTTRGSAAVWAGTRQPVEEDLAETRTLAELTEYARAGHTEVERLLNGGGVAAARRWLHAYLDVAVRPLLRAAEGDVALPSPAQVLLALDDGFPAAAFVTGGQWLTTDRAAADVQVRAMLLGEHVFELIGALAGVGQDPAATEEALLADLAARIPQEFPAGWTASAIPRAGVLNTALDAVNHPRPRPGTAYLEIPNPLGRAESAPPEVPLPPVAGRWTLRRAEVTDAADGGPDVALVHGWMNAEHVARNWHQDWSVQQWREELAGQLAGEHKVPMIAKLDGAELAYLEIYRVARDRLAPCYAHHPHDLGVHIALGAPGSTGRGLGPDLLGEVARALLTADPACRRLVAEPDVHNVGSIGAFTKAGFVRDREIGLPAKNSALMVFERCG